MNGRSDKLSATEIVFQQSFPEKFSEFFLERCVNVFKGLKSDVKMMILAIDSQDYVGMLVHEFAKNNPETRELFFDQKFKILIVPRLLARRIISFTHSFLSTDLISFEEAALDSCHEPILIFSDSKTFLIDCESII